MVRHPVQVAGLGQLGAPWEIVGDVFGPIYGSIFPSQDAQIADDISKRNAAMVKMLVQATQAAAVIGAGVLLVVMLNKRKARA